MSLRRISATLLLLLAGSAGAQAPGFDAAVEIGGARVRQGGLVRGDALTVGATTQASLGATNVSLAGMASRAEGLAGSSQWAGTAALGVAHWFRPTARTRLETSLDAQTIQPTDAATTGSALGFVRLYRDLRGSRWGWIGAGGGTAGSSRSTRRALVGDLGLVQPLGALQLSVGSSVVATRTGPVLVALPDQWIEVKQPIRYAEPTAGARFAWRAIELGADAGLRMVWKGAEPSLSPRPPHRLPWMLLSAGWQVMPHLAVIASGGRALEDPIRGMPATHYVTLGGRVSLRAARSSRQPRHAESEAPVATVELRNGARVLVVRAKGARVEAMGTLTGWEPVMLEPRDGAWELPIAAAPGGHRLVVRVDGGAWRAPVNLPTTADEFGGRVGLLTVP